MAQDLFYEDLLRENFHLPKRLSTSLLHHDEGGKSFCNLRGSAVEFAIDGPELTGGLMGICIIQSMREEDYIDLDLDLWLSETVSAGLYPKESQLEHRWACGTEESAQQALLLNLPRQVVSPITTVTVKRQLEADPVSAGTAGAGCALSLVQQADQSAASQGVRKARPRTRAMCLHGKEKAKRTERCRIAIKTLAMMKVAFST
ncbi:hypothetical protein EYF80_030901 [Liparis tanakae]|uniref:Uncharacterized protein n=1 Tax=Liparis tanakae TaxID=230148 RepID=A0A4Z2GZY1_9TELE|nr:hypothetical protein EYF80_030901 [Liparis tanakae]